MNNKDNTYTINNPRTSSSNLTRQTSAHPHIHTPAIIMTTLQSRKLSSEEKKTPLDWRGKGGASSSLAVGKKPIPQTPPKAGALQPRDVDKPTAFRAFYDRGDLPIRVAFDGAARKLQWGHEFEKLDYHVYLPIFFEGVREKKEPYKFIARTGTYDLLSKGGDRILSVVPQLIMPIKCESTEQMNEH